MDQNCDHFALISTRANGCTNKGNVIDMMSFWERPIILLLRGVIAGKLTLDPLFVEVKGFVYHIICFDGNWLVGPLQVPLNAC